jgi:hypothetical protein
MATALSSIRSQARIHLKETTASFWTEAELLDIILKGIADLWGAVIDLNQEHFQTVDESNVSLAANSDSLTGVPSDCFRVSLIEPRDTTSAGASRNVMFVPRDFASNDFINARSLSAQDPSGGLIVNYCLMGAGSPVSAPTVRTAPKLSSAMNLRFVYVPTLDLSSFDASDNNPIPGESDNALIAWTVAYARVKEREDRSPDPNWLAVYATEKQNILTRLTPRQTQEPEIVEDLFSQNW